MREERKVYKILVGKPKGKRLKCGSQDGFKTDLRETGCEGVVWIHLAQERNWWQALVSMVMNLWVLAPQS
jgi:hypothetical protein